jgi:hypothetical protein
MGEDESALSEITILPDGRVYAFGITSSISALLKSLASGEGSRREQTGGAEAALPIMSRSLPREEPE